MKLLAQAKAETATEETKTRIAVYERSLNRYKDLIPKIEALEAKVKNSKEPVELEVLSQLDSNNNSVNTSGGVYFGDIFETVVYDDRGNARTNPLGIFKAFGESVNQSGGVLLSNFYDGLFMVAKNGSMESASIVHSNITIPESQANKFLKGVKNYNGSIFALIPTNTLTRDGKHIYMPYQLYTKNLNNVQLTRDRNATSDTIPEAMLNAIMNPNTNADEFQAMVRFSKLETLYKPGKTIQEQDKRFIDAFYNTDNLLAIFNSVTYVYNGAKEFKSPTSNVDYSKHIGLDVFYPKNSGISNKRQEELDKKAAEGTLTDAERMEGKRFPIIRFDLSVDGVQKNTYAINLFDEKGMFSPKFGKVKRSMGQMNRESREELTDAGIPKAYQEVTVDVLEDIKKRFNQKIFRPDKLLISNTTNGAKYNGFSFNDKGRLSLGSYDSYMHYLNAHQFLESTVYGLKVRSADRTQEGMSFFHNRSFYLTEPTAEKKKDAKAEKKAKNPNAKTRKRKAAVKNNKTTENGTAVVTVTVPDVLINAIADTKSGKNKLSPDGSTYLINGVPHARVSNLLGSAYSSGESIATAAGTQVHTLANDFFNGTVGYASDYNFSEEAFEQMVNKLRAVKAGFRNGEKVLASEVIIHGVVNGQLVAGTMDFVTIDADGNYRIYDWKTSSKGFSKTIYETNKRNVDIPRITGFDSSSKTGATFSDAGRTVERSTKDTHHAQLSLYNVLFEQMTGQAATEMSVFPFTLLYEESGGSVQIESVTAYPKVSFGNELYPSIMSTKVEAKIEESLLSKEETQVNEESVITPAKKDEILKTGSLFRDISGEHTFEDEDEDAGTSEMSSIVPISDDELREANRIKKNQEFRLIFRDPGRLRNYAHDMAKQSAATEFVTDLMTRFLYNRRIVENDVSAATLEDIKNGVVDQIDNLIDEKQRMIAFGKYYNKAGNLVGFTQSRINTLTNQIAELQSVRRFIDIQDMDPLDRETSRDFIGYLRLGLITLNANKLVKINAINDDFDLNEIESNDDEIISTAKFAENYSVKLDPKSSVTVDGKIMLSQMQQMERVEDNKGAYSFRTVGNRFGFAKRYNLTGVLNELHIEFENMAPESFMNNLQDLSSKSPYIHSLFVTIDNLSRKADGSVDKYRKLDNFRKLAGVIKHHRELLFMNVTLADGEKNKTTSVGIGDAARQGITESILKKWEVNFVYNFNNLFTLDEIEKNGEKVSNAVAKKQDDIYGTDSKNVNSFEVSLPDGFDNYDSSYAMYDLLYNQLREAVSKGKVKVNFKFDVDSKFVLNGKKTILTSSDVLHIASMFQLGSQIVFDKSMKPEIDATRNVIQDTTLSQIVSNLKYLLTEKRGDFAGNEGPKSFTTYSPLIYKMMASQLDRLGIQLSEKPESSYLVLSDLNSSSSSRGRFMKYQRYDSKATSFSGFLISQIDNLVVAKLGKPGALSVSNDRQDGENGPRSRVSIDNPLNIARQGLYSLASHARTEWVQFSNETIRNAKGDLEYTYSPHNTLSLWVNKLKDGNTKLLDNLAQTPMGKYNYWIQDMIKNPQALSSFKLKYIDGGRLNRFKNFNPENITLGTDQLIEWNAYYNGEGRSSGRSEGYCITTYGDSTIMPAMNFNKETISLKMREEVDERGTVQHIIELDETGIDGSLNPIYNKLYSNFRGELERVKQSFEAYQDIINHSEDFDEQKEYALANNYTMYADFQIATKNGKKSIVPGNGTRFYFLGNKMFIKEDLKSFYNSDFTGLSEYLIDGSGEINEDEVKKLFNPVINKVLNDMIDDAYNGLLEQKDAFYKIVESNHSNEDDTKTKKLSIQFPYLDHNSVQFMKSAFEKNVSVIQGDQEFSPKTMDTYIERDYGEGWLKNPRNLPKIILTVDGFEEGSKKIADDQTTGLTPNEIDDYKKRFLIIKKREQENDRKRVRAPHALMKYMIADRIINEYVFRVSLYQATFDPAIVTKADDYINFHYDFVKRSSSMIAPGTPSLMDSTPGHDIVRIIPVKDPILGNVYKEYSDEEFSNMDVSEYSFLQAFKSKFPEMIKGNKFPARLIEYAAMYNARSAMEKDEFMNTIKQKLKGVKPNDAGSYMTAREYLYTELQSGRITTADYFEAADAFQYGFALSEKLVRKLNIGVKKNVYGGSNFKDTPVGTTLYNNYIKNAMYPLIKGYTVFPDTPLWDLATEMENIEAKEYKAYSYSKPRGGIMMVHPTAYKLGFSSDTDLYNEDGSLNRDISKVNTVYADRAYLRTQIESSRTEKDRSTISSQANKYKGFDIPSYYRFGKGFGTLEFSMNKTKVDILSATEQVELDNIEAETFTTKGLSMLQMDTVNYRIYRQMAINKIEELSEKMGFVFDSSKVDYSIVDAAKFIENIKNHAIEQYGMSSTAVANLNIDAGTNRIMFPITMTPNNMKFQSIILSQLSKMFSQFTLPGGSYATISARGLTGDSDLRSFRMKTITSTYPDEKALKAELGEEEIAKRTDNKDGSITVEHYEVIPGEAAIVWNFKDASGNVLNYSDYVNQDGTIKMIDVNGKMVSAIDEELLYIIVNRIPNTGLNTTSRLKIVRFFPPSAKDVIAMAPEIVDIYNADHDYDKLYTYVFNHEVTEDGRLSKIKSVYHYTQKGAEDLITSNNAKRSVARSLLMKNNKEYAKMKLALSVQDDLLNQDVDIDNPDFRVVKNKEISKGDITSMNADLKRLETALKKAESKNDSQRVKDIKNQIDILRDAVKNKETELQLKTIENEYMQSEEFANEFKKSSIYSMQTQEQLENALLEGYHILVGDIKTMRQSTHFLSADWFHNQLDKTVVTDNGPMSIRNMFEGGSYFNIGSFWTHSKTRAGNAEAAKMVGVAANMQHSLYLAQRNGLSHNAMWSNSFSDKDSNKEAFVKYADLDEFDIEDLGVNPKTIVDPNSNPSQNYYILFKDNKGMIKQEEGHTSIEESDIIPVGSEEDIEDSEENRISADNRPFASNANPSNIYNAWHKNKKIGRIYYAPETGRYRFDRIYTMTNNGEKFNISSAVQAVLQAFLDNKNNPVMSYMNMNSKTANAFMDLVFKGYVDEAPLLLMQESVDIYVNKINDSTKVEANEKTNYFNHQIDTIADITGASTKDLTAMYYSLPEVSRNIHNLLFKLIKNNVEQNNEGNFELSDLALSENELKDMIAMRLGYKEKTNTYITDQLKALRTFLLASNSGQGLFTVQQATNADSKGLKNTAVDVQIQRDNFLNLFVTNKTDSGDYFYSSAPTVAGLHRLTPYWSRNVKRRQISNRSSNWVPGNPAFTYSYGIKAAYDILSSLGDNNILYEYSDLFREMQKSFASTIGSSLRTMNATEKSRILRKLNVNFVSFLLSNPALYEGIFTGPNAKEEFEFFKEYGNRALRLPDTGLPVREDYELFNEVNSLASDIKVIADRVSEDTGIPYRNIYDVLNVLNPIPSVKGDRPTSVILPASTRFQENIGLKISISLSAMYESGVPELVKTVKRLILYAYKTGGITTPNSFVQHLPPHILSEIGMDKVLFKSLQALTDSRELKSGETRINQLAKGAIDTFVLQYLQHNRFDMKDNINPEKLESFESTNKEGETVYGKVVFDKSLGRRMIKMLDTHNDEAKKLELIRYNNKFYAAIGNNPLSFYELDYAGNPFYHDGEYNYNTIKTPVSSLFAANKSEGAKKEITGVVEKNFGFQMSDTEEADNEFRRKAELYEMPFINKMNHAMQIARNSKDSTIPASDFMELMASSNNESLSGVAFNLMSNIIRLNDTKVRFYSDPTSATAMSMDYTGNTISINTGHFKYGELTDINEQEFINDFAHEVVHVGTGFGIGLVMTGKTNNTSVLPGMTAAVENIIRLREALNKKLLADKTEDGTNYRKYIALLEKTKTGELNQEERAFLLTHNYFRGVRDAYGPESISIQTGKKYAQNEINQIREFAAYVFNDNFQGLLNRTSFKDTKTNTTFWEKLKEFLKDLLSFFGLTDSVEVLSNVEYLQKQFTKIQGYKKMPSYSEDGTGKFSRFNFEASEDIKNLKPYSGLQVALNQIFAIRNIANNEANMNSFGEGSSSMSSLLSSPYVLDSLYQGVDNFDMSWPAELKILYHQAASNGSIIC
jgi:hypothetical protein